MLRDLVLNNVHSTTFLTAVGLTNSLAPEFGDSSPNSQQPAIDPYPEPI
jgi:hypothetical protein